MSRIVFWEKPGCGGNARQKALLQQAGHELEVRDLLREAWTEERLLAFFGELPVAEWFNRSAPQVKNGEVVPERLDRQAALALLLATPLLIRRPLMQDERGRTHVGFEPRAVEAWIGLGEALAPALAGAAPERCVGGPAHRCPEPDQLSRHEHRSRQP